MRRNEDIGVRLKKCPKCGGEIEISFLNQYSYIHKLTKSGRISKRCKKEDNGTMEVAIARCCTCETNWGDGEFDIDEGGYFVDYKYSRGGRL